MSFIAPHHYKMLVMDFSVIITHHDCQKIVAESTVILQFIHGLLHFQQADFFKKKLFCNKKLKFISTKMTNIFFSVFGTCLEGVKSSFQFYMYINFNVFTLTTIWKQYLRHCCCDSFSWVWKAKSISTLTSIRTILISYKKQLVPDILYQQ